MERGTGVERVVFAKHFLEVVNSKEVGQLVVIRFSHFTAVDEFEDDSSKVIGCSNTPCVEYADGHHSEMLKTQHADAIQQFPAGDMAGFLCAAVSTQLFLSKTQRGEYKFIRLGVVCSLTWSIGDGRHSWQSTLQCRKNTSNVNTALRFYNEMSSG